jgi:ParB family chromosome partitioning protein
VAKKALGKGLDALIPQAVIESINSGSMLQIPLERIRANPFQPRKLFDKEKIESLAESIRKDGLLQPVIVRRVGDEYELVMGERRIQAARLAGVPAVPAVLRDVADIDTLRLALVENLQRENLNPLEIAEAYRILTESFGLSMVELAEFLGKDRSTVTNTMRLLGLPDEIQETIREGKITEGHARAVLALDTEEERIALAKRIVNKQLSVRQAEAEAGLGRQAKMRVKKQKEKPVHITYLENAISAHLSTRVNIEEKRGGRGRITIEFYNHEDFERLAALMNIPLPR